MYAENLFVGLALPLFVALLFVRGRSRHVCGALLAGMAVCLLSAYIDSFLLSVSGMSLDDAAVYLTPVTEEAMKLAPLLFYFLVAEPSDDDLLIAAVMVGAGFATFENACYLLDVGTEQLSYVLIRGLAVGVMHVVCALATGFGLTLVRKVQRMAAIGTLGIFAYTVTYHAVYNLLVSAPGVSRGIGYVLPLFTAALFFAISRLHPREAE